MLKSSDIIAEQIKEDRNTFSLNSTEKEKQETKKRKKKEKRDFFNFSLFLTHKKVILLLKSSDIIAEQIEEYRNTFSLNSERESTIESPFYIVLKKFYSINPSMEFRCVVKKKKLIGKLFSLFLFPFSTP